MGLFPSLEVFFSSYGSYHHNTINKLIHIFCIPLILLSATQIITSTCPKVQGFDLSLIIILILSIVYLQVDLISGILAALFYTTSTILLNNYYHGLSAHEQLHHLHSAIGVHVICWILQFIGHGVFEKRAPALLDNILQIFVAPDFVVIEILFHLGYKHDTYIKCKQLIKENIANFKKQA